MDVYTTEEEQVEQIKKWWRQYGKTFALIVVLMTALGFAWQHWQAYQINQRQAASIVFDTLLNQQANHESEALDKTAMTLITHHPKTPYASLARLILAKQAIVDKQDKKAEAALQWVTSHSNMPAVKQIARLHLAELYTAQHHYAKALTTLKTIDDTAFKPMIDEMLGDVFVHLKQIKQARKSYQAALIALPDSGLLKPILQLKLDRYHS